MDAKKFRGHAHRVADWMVDYLEQVERYPVRAPVAPGEIRLQIPRSPPTEAVDLGLIMKDFEHVLLPGMTHWQHPSFFAYFQANSSPPSVLAEMITAALGAQCMSWETSPAATELEEAVLEWLREMTGLPDGFVGSIQDTASSATVTALVVARERATAGRANRTGLGREAPLTVYCSEEAHSSVEKAVGIVGIGRDQLRKIPVRDDGALDGPRLQVAIAADQDAGLVPAAVVASLGTTGASGFDRLAEIGPLCGERGLWLHVDAAWAGSALILPEYRWMIDGIDYVDSLVFNPHKWLFTNFDCSAFYVRDVDALLDAMSILPEYLRTRQQGVTNYRDWGIALGRRFRALKLWFVIRSYGVKGLQEMIRNHITWAGEFAAAIDADPDFELIRAPVLSLLCFRYRPAGHPVSDLDELNERLVQELNDSGALYVNHTRLAGDYVIRFVVGQTHTTRAHVMAGWDTIRRIAQSLGG